MSFLYQEGRVWLAALIVAALYLVAQAMTDDPAPHFSPNNQAEIYRSEQ